LFLLDKERLKRERLKKKMGKNLGLLATLLLLSALAAFCPAVAAFKASDFKYAHILSSPYGLTHTADSAPSRAFARAIAPLPNSHTCTALA
jgi:hypothetical protein